MPVIYHTYQIDIVKMEAAAPADGFIDRKKIQDYMVFDTTTHLMSDFAISYDNVVAKERANMRYLHAIQNLSDTISPIDIHPDDAFSNGDTNVAPTIYRILVTYDRPDYLYTADELNPGVTLTGLDAIKRQVARVFITDIFSRRIMPDPITSSGSPNDKATWAGLYKTIIDVEAAKPVTSLLDAESKITVVQLYPES